MPGYLRPRDRRKNKRGPCTCWQLVVGAGRDVNGERRQCFRTFHGTKREAEQALAEFSTEVQRNGVPRTEKITVGQLLDRWLDARWREFAPTSRERYKGIIRCNVKPQIGSLLVSKLRPLEIAELYKRLQDGGLSGTTTLHVHRLLHTAFRWAVRMQVIDRSVIEQVDAPKASTKEAIPLTADQAAQILSLAEGMRWHSPFVFAFATGARRGEICGLRWEDVDMQKGVVTIRSSLCHTKDGVIRKSTKTGKSRAILLSQSASDALKAARLSQTKDRLRAGAAYHDQGYAFADVLGNPMKPHALSDAFRSVTRRAGLPRMKFHAIRHTAATWMLAEGADLKNIQKILGHSAASTTLNTYGHLVPHLQRYAVDAIEANLKDAVPRRTKTGT